MATHFLGLSSQFSYTIPTLMIASLPPNRRSSMQIASLVKSKPWRAICGVSTENTQITIENNRRSANYEPNLWNFEFLQSLGNDLEVEAPQERVTRLEEEVRGMMNNEETEPRRLLDLIDNVKRLGLAYKFEKDIKKGLERIVISLDEIKKIELDFTALGFRLLREYGFQVSQDMFENFKDEEGNFKAEISSDVQGLLNLYEASYLAFEGETLLDEAREFSITHLKNNLKRVTNTKLAKQVSHALELPYHRRLHRLEARWFINIYEEEEPHNHLLLELAKLDFNMVQSLMQKELQELSRWWKEIGLASKLDFARDRLIEVYFWALGMAPDPQFSDCRKVITKMFGLVTIIDDVYDVYGTLNDLEIFTNVVDRWDVNGINALPEYMKLCFLALYNTVNDTTYGILKEKGQNSLPCLAKSWSDVCKAFLQEAKWSNNKIIPAFNEYLENALVSSSGGALLAPSYFLSGLDNTNQALDSLTDYYGLVRPSCTIFRLCNDLATSEAELERGETTNSITSYTYETRTSKEQARQNLRILIDTEWKKMNQERFLDSKFPKAFMEIAINMARISHCTYQYGDGLGRPDNIAQNRIKWLLIEPISINRPIKLRFLVPFDIVGDSWTLGEDSSSSVLARSKEKKEKINSSHAFITERLPNEARVSNNWVKHNMLLEKENAMRSLSRLATGHRNELRFYEKLEIIGLPFFVPDLNSSEHLEHVELKRRPFIIVRRANRTTTNNSPKAYQAIAAFELHAWHATVRAP
ncbi:hypothetical protein VNO77_19723 [Canavalia gladiata]|uniref:Uncharacterized protein n=1 Tax=Canavalia gladiata TaxID=3824 RepID=A0AAN9QIR7_CANGL